MNNSLRIEQQKVRNSRLHRTKNGGKTKKRKYNINKKNVG